MSRQPESETGHELVTKRSRPRRNDRSGLHNITETRLHFATDRKDVDIISDSDAMLIDQWRCH